MTLREQLAEVVAEVRAEWKQASPVGGAARYRTVEIEVRLPTAPMTAIGGARSRVNASETCGAGAGHLRFVDSQVRREDHDGWPAFPDFRVVVRLAYHESPQRRSSWGAYLTADFDELLAALEPGAGPGCLQWANKYPALPKLPPAPARQETWRDRPPLL